MKYYRTICIIIFCLIGYFTILPMTVKAQPQWKFHMAYEDATGARDTIWFIWDTTASFYGADTLLGEVSANMNLNEFNVWTYNNGLTWLDSIKVVANPYTYSFGIIIQAINVELPVKVTWDTSLLHAPYLPPQPVGWVNFARMDNDYFFMVNNHPTAHQFDMTFTDNILVPDTNITNPWFWNTYVHFPVDVYLYQDPTFSIPKDNVKEIRNIYSYPNPFTTSTTIEYELTEPSHVQLTIYNAIGETIFMSEDGIMPQGIHSFTWTPDRLPKGMYYGVLRSEEGVEVVKMVKQ